ncbi:hypothetical protein VNO78_19757 [Psophocarpus tetragonolobus]|uniref:Uncharacterized protein n=1 Tax=Psophocarpus tetragonolobus TaxID=3891 RepID=A0AAN9XG44_PSOTE
MTDDQRWWLVTGGRSQHVLLRARHSEALLSPQQHVGTDLRVPEEGIEDRGLREAHHLGGRHDDGYGILNPPIQGGGNPYSREVHALI